jgi:hypothetical protein
VRKNANVKGRWHDNRHTLITELAESGAGDQTIMDIAGNVSKQMLKHYSHIRMEAKRSALESIVTARPAKVESGESSQQREEYPQRSHSSCKAADGRRIIAPLASTAKGRTRRLMPRVNAQNRP